MTMKMTAPAKKSQLTVKARTKKERPKTEFATTSLFMFFKGNKRFIYLQ